ncbi:hypothetical protein K523DRAFT_242574 [Schizophyllum commune Tattone D]|nr:hypothetical protein K523DRAFT_242574 [Schizophyllum commune Tattone D]
MPTDLTVADYQTILAFTTNLARRAGEVILAGSQAIRNAPASEINEKKNSVDLVTEYDVKVEELVKKEIAGKYPNFDFLGEESYAAGSRPSLSEKPTFCVDPIDGTTNFIHGFPFVCISLGLIYKKKPVLGVIYNPFLDHLYTAITGQGAFVTEGINNQPLRLPLTIEPRPLTSLSQGLLGIEWGADRSEEILAKKSASFYRLAGNPEAGVKGGKMAHSLRSLGSAALNFTLVARGSLDVYWEIGCYPWDVCAGIVIAQEAGGLVTGSHQVFAATKDDASKFGEVSEEILWGRKYVVVRAIGPAPGESKVEAQKRIIGELYDSVDDAEPTK